MEQEGIFRISPSKDEMEQVKRALNAVGIAGMAKEDIPTQNVYLTCALLKEWLRSLVESVIPPNQYNACITIVKKSIAAEDAAASAATAAAAMGSLNAGAGSPHRGVGGSPSTPLGVGKTLAGVGRGSFTSSNSATSSQLASLVSSLPLVNQRVLQVLADFVDEIIDERNQKLNRMTLENLSIVFAPCLLRSTSEDPQELLLNSKYEIKFLVLLFRTMANAPSSQTMCVTQLQKGVDY